MYPKNWILHFATNINLSKNRLPLAPGKVERREFEYVRHGTRSFIVSRDVVTGHILAPACGPTRTEADFLAHLQAVVATQPQAARWHVVCDRLNTHQSESLVRWVADLSDSKEDLGVKGESGILASMVSRAAFLSDPSHHVVFHYTPKHSSWLNQIEIWLSILVRKLLKRGSFSSVEDLQAHGMRNEFALEKSNARESVLDGSHVCLRQQSRCSLHGL